MGDRVERAGIEPVGKRIAHQEPRHLEHARIARVLDAVALERAEIVGVPELAAQLLEELPVAVRALLADLGGQMGAKVSGDPVVVEQRVVDIEEGHELHRRPLSSVPQRALCARATR